MQPVALRWLSAQTVQAVQQAVHSAACHWARSWGVEEPGEPIVQAVPSWPAADAGDLNLADDAAPTPSWAAALNKALFPGDAGHSKVAATVVAEASDQLKAVLRRALGLGREGQDNTTRDLDPAPRGHAGVLVQLTVLHHVLWACAPCAALAREGLLRVPAPDAVPGWSAEQTLAATRVPLQAVLGEVEVDVLDVLNLGPGDVLLLPRPGLDATVQVQGIGTPLRLPARLGAHSSHRAVQWHAPATTP